jgi:DnaA N-terminal domain
VSCIGFRFPRTKGGQDQTLFELAPLETPAETPAKTPAANARAGKEPQNPRTKTHPPSPPEGGSPPDAIFVEETHVTAHGRKRRRSVRVDLDEVRRHLGIPGLVDHDDWEQVRNHLRELVGDSTFEIWLQPLELIAVDPVGTLVIAAPAATRGWVEQRFSRVLARCGEQHSRAMRLANEPERRAFGREERARSSAVRAVHINEREVS